MHRASAVSIDHNVKSIIDVGSVLKNVTKHVLEESSDTHKRHTAVKKKKKQLNDPRDTKASIVAARSQPHFFTDTNGC